jgi:hypothetical protein
MQKKNKYFHLPIFLLFLIPSLSTAQGIGYLSVTAGDSMQIYVDTLFAGVKKVSYLELPTGSYTVHAYNPYHLSWSDRGSTREVRITSGEHARLDLRQEEEVKVISLPFGSQVFIGNDLLGQTPLSFDRRAFDDQTLRIENKGYQNKTLNLLQGQNVYRVSLDPLEPGKKQIRLARYKDNENSIKWYREGLIVVSLASSWASFYFKREADKSYSRYQRASDSSDMISLYASTERYDRMSEIAIAVSAVSLGTYLYLLLFQ